ncbi:MAG: orotate phosphoribosyltransferase [Planctomycetota bacterium]|nr:MAG: orotate phosphoribosyltransferase [Planctomycetota bacterium]
MDDQVIAQLRESGALLEGHFLLSSGRHAAQYVQCAQVLQYPERAEALCRRLAEQIQAASGEARPYDVVVGPAMGAVTFAYELARALGGRGLFAERHPEGGFQLRRGFRIESHERVLVAEDVVTTGGSAREVLAMLQTLGIRTTAVASLVNRSGANAKPFGELSYYRLLDLEVPNWTAEACPLCQEGSTPIKPGSRPQASA